MMTSDPPIYVLAETGNGGIGSSRVFFDQFLAVRDQKAGKMAALPAKAASLLKTGLVLAKPKLQVFKQYALVELTPPKLSDIPAIRTGIKNILVSAKNGSYRNLTVKEAWLNTLVAVEVLCWFYVGEVIGKRHIVGYKV